MTDIVTITPRPAVDLSTWVERIVPIHKLNYPEIARFLTEPAIDSISINPSSILRTMAIVHEAERSMAKVVAS